MRVRIYQPCKSATQDGTAKTQNWLVEPELVAARLPEPLMGWLSAGDTNSALQNKLRFASVEAATAFALKNGWEYYVDLPTERIVQPRSGSDHYRVQRPQDEERLARRS